MAATLLQEISKDERERAILRSRRMAETDRISDLLTSERKGKIEGEKLANEKWQAIVAEIMIDNDAKLADIGAKLADKAAELTDKEAEIAGKDEQIELLRSQVAELKAKNVGN